MCSRLIYLISVILMLGTASSVALADMVAYYPMDEGSGTLVKDASGNGHDGEFVDTGPEWVPSQGGYGAALWFPGETNPQSIVDTGVWNPSENTDQLSVAVWIKWEGLNGFYQGIVAKNINWSDTGTYWNLELHIDTGNIGFGQFGGYQWFGTNIPPVDEWQHTTVTFDGTTAILYLNGQEVGTANFSFGVAVNAPVVIGAGYMGGWNPFNGTIDEVRLYDHVLSEFDLHAIAVTNFRQAWKPRPADGQVDVLLDQKLIWNQGIISDETFELYNEHNVYFGTDFNDVSTATEPTAIVTDENEYATPLDYDTTYYWRVDEASSLDPNSPVRGEVWNFTAANFIVVEDFEDYNDFPPDEVWNTWIDGFDDPANGSTAGYPAPDFFAGEHYMEDEIVHGGNWSMPVFYDNSEAGISEVTRTLNADWTQDDVLTLTLFYYGDAGNAAEPMYVALNGNAVVTNDDPKAAMDNEWNQWDILLQEFADQGVNLANVTTLTIGFGNKANPQAGGGDGHVFFDDIRLYRSLPEEAEPEPESVDPGTDNLVAYYAFENNTQDGSGNGQHGTASGSPQYVSGPTGYGMAMAFDGNNDYVTLPIGSAIAQMNDITIACWADFSNEGGSFQRIWDFGTGTDNYIFVTPRIGNNGELRFAINTEGVAEINITAPATLPSGWHHVTVSIDSASMTMKLYQDGKLVAEGETLVLPSDLGETTQNYLGRSQWAADAYYDGSLDEFRIYDRALSHGEIRYLAGK